MNLNRVAYTLSLIADGYLLHSAPTWVPRQNRAYFICAAIDHVCNDGMVTESDRRQTYDWLAELGMRGNWPFSEVGSGFYRTYFMSDDKQAVRWTWLKFAARLARSEAYQLRRNSGQAS
jgi:hypothetical protein